MAERTRLRRALRWMVRVSLVLAGIALLLGAWGAWELDRRILSELPEDLAEYRGFRPLTICKLRAADGQVVDEFYVERRVWVPLDELPSHVWQAFVAAEDRRFLEHHGVDYKGIVRALVINYRTGETSQGASTITQQLVKNLLVGSERSYERKLREAVLAWRLEAELDKEELLQLYVNFVALGNGNYGVEAASRDYFGISARELDAGQAALLAGLVPAPSRYSPRRDPETAAHRRLIVLRSMVDQGYLDSEVASTFLDDPVLVPRPAGEEDRVGLAYITQTRREVRRLLGEELPFSLGLDVRTPLDLEVQAVAEAAVREAVDSHVRRRGALLPLRRLAEGEREAFHAAARQEPPGPSDCLEVVVGRRGLEELRAGPWTGALDRADRDLPVHSPEATSPPSLRNTTRPGDVLPVCLDADGRVRLDARPWAQAAAAAVDHRTGAVVALVGGYEDGLEGFVRATQARRQPGSSFKPYVYAAALAAGRSQLDSVLDAPLSLPAGGGKTWSPKNYSGGYSGSVTLRSALARSLNTPSVRLTMEVGPEEVVRTARAMGVSTPLRRDLTVALGSSEVTPMDQALGYGSIARGGRSLDAVYLAELHDVDGHALASAGGTLRLADGRDVILPGGPGRRVLPAGVAYQLADVLGEVVRGGTGRRAWVPDQERAGKTGTTNGYVDAWFVGFTPTHVVAVWVGTDGPSSLGHGETGSRAALPAWVRIIDALPSTAGTRLPIPPQAVLVPHGGAWVALERGSVPQAVLATPRPAPRPLPPFGGWPTSAPQQ